MLEDSLPDKKIPKNAVIAQKPLPAMQKPLKIEIGPFFKALGKSLTDIATIKWENLGNDFLEVTLALGLKTQPEELGYLLINRSLARALIDIIGESVNQFPAEQSSHHNWEKEIGVEMQYFDVSLDESFFKSPAKSPLLPHLEGILLSWLRSQGMGELAAIAISRRFPAYFVYSLHYELGRNKKHYEQLVETIRSPVSTAATREVLRETYTSLLHRQSEEGVFDEPFSLREIYIPLRACYHEECRRNNTITTPHLFEDSERAARKVVDLCEELNSWLNIQDKDDAIRVISGGPGSGKSAFSKIFAADLALQERHVLLIPLHLIDPESDLIDQIGGFSKQDGSLGFNPLDADNPEDGLILIFDGLDELANQGRSGLNSAREFVESVQRMTSLRNLTKCNIQVIVSGRELSVQENESLFKKPGQILDLLPYYLPAEEIPGPDTIRYHDPKGLLGHDLRNSWWTNYGKLTGNGYTGLPNELSHSDLDEITSQPLLNYLLALSFTRGRLKFDANLNLNRVYADLIEAVHERGYDKGRTHANIKHMNLRDFSRVLEEIGLAAWHGDGRTTTIKEIQEHCKQSGVNNLLESFKEGAEKGVTRLLAAFFFRRYGQRPSGDQTFVFSHKSFGEYLAARRVVLAVAKMSRELAAREADPDEGRDERELLEIWGRFCGPSAITTYLLKFIRREIALHDAKDVAIWQTSLAKLFSSILKKGLPIEKLLLQNFREESRQCRNAEEALLAVLNACSRVTKRVTKLAPQQDIAFGNWLKRVQEQRRGPEPCVALKCLSYLDMTGYCLHLQDFYGAEMDHSILSGVEANYAIFVAANLTRCDLRGCHLWNASFASADLSFSNMENSYFHAVNFARSQINSCNMRKADLSDSDFSKATLHKVDLTDANIEGANFKTAQIRDSKGIPSHRSLSSRKNK